MHLANGCPLFFISETNVLNFFVVRRFDFAVSYPMLIMAHPTRNSFVMCLCMFVWLRVQGFESSINKVFQKEKLVNSKTKIYSPQLKELVQQELT